LCRRHENSFELYRKTKGDATYKTKLTFLVSWNYMRVFTVTFITFVTIVTVKLSNYMKVTYFDMIYASFLGRRWPCILWVSLMNQKTCLMLCV